MDLKDKRKYIKVGEQVSNSLKDIMSDTPEKELRFYLKHLFPFGKDFIYNNFNRTLEMFKNTSPRPKVIEIIDGEEVAVNPLPIPRNKKVIKTSGIPSYQENEIFEFQCEPNYPIIHTIYIDYATIKNKYEQLNRKQRAYLYGYIHPNATLPPELIKYEKTIHKLKNNKPRSFQRYRLEAIKDLCKLLCDI